MAKVIGIGSALVDLLIKLDDDLLLDVLKLPKGSMILVDEMTKNLIATKAELLEKEMVSGGSAANTIHGLAKLGVETAFLGIVGNDETGDFFFADLEKSKIFPKLKRSATASGIASTLVSKDGERTFGTYLGASVELSGDHITDDDFAGFDILHVEGYIVHNHELLESVLRKAKTAGLKISLDLASYNVVEDNLDFLKEMVARYVDIVFANEEESRAFTGKEDPMEALKILAENTELAIVKVGKNGSLVMFEDALYKIPPVLTNSIDTTGAGDLYAAGFLYGFFNKLGIMNAGYLGSLMASKVIENYGAKIPESSFAFIKKEIASLGSI
ncbi:MAG: adenosine kinase [Bacteroidetes bacterium]|nr:adenosine kinase [Bacteroidota bacterium]